MLIAGIDNYSKSGGGRVMAIVKHTGFKEVI